MKKGATILIVDDEPDNVGILYQLLETRAEYRVLVATDGPSALEISNQEEVDLILLDVMMPGMNGFEVCSGLKKDPSLADIPVIFLTALTENSHKVEAFHSGGIDYITKPFHQEEVLVRIETHLSVSKMRRELQEQNDQLQAFSYAVAHDLKNPLGAIVLGAEDLQEELAQRKIEGLEEWIDGILTSSRKGIDIIDALLLLSRVSVSTEVEFSTFSPESAVQSALQQLEETISHSSAIIHLPSEWPRIQSYPPWVEQVLVNYISNALKYGGRPPEIHIQCETRDEKVRISVRDNGPGLSPEEQSLLFIPFSRLHKERASGHGLGLSIVQKIVHRLGGVAGVESEPGKGSLFFISLPVSPEG